jgi:hypothetical protein
MANVNSKLYANQFKPIYNQSKSQVMLIVLSRRLCQSKEIFFQTYTNYVKPFLRLKNMIFLATQDVINTQGSILFVNN